MSQWIDDQAEESEHEQDDVPVSKRARIASDDDEEEEEEDESKIYEEMKGFVVTGDDEEEDGEGNEEDKKSDSEEEEEEELLEDDEELLEENLGISVKKRKRRVQLGSDSEAEDEKQDLEKQLFEGGEDEEEHDEDIRRSKPGPSRRTEEYEEGEDVSAESGEESGVDDFIEDDEGETAKVRSKKKIRRRIPISDSALQEAREIFGDAIDLEDLYGGEDDEEEAEDVEQDEYEKEGENENERPVERRQRIGKKRTQKKTLLDTLEPSDLDRGFLSEIDKKIQLEDKPERFQLRGIPVSEVSPDEVISESTWIFKHLFALQSVSLQVTQFSKKMELVNEKIQQTLSFIRNNEFEVPFIAFYRKEYVDAPVHDPSGGLQLADLWRIYHSDEKWCQMRARMENLARLFSRMQTFQYDFIVADPNKPLTDDVRMLTNNDIEQIYKVETPEELQDVYLHFLLYYGRDLPKMMEYERAKAVQGAGNEHEPMTPLKQAYRRDKYSLCVDANLCGLAKMFGLKAEDFAANATRNYPVNRIQDYPLTPTEAAEQDEFKSDQFNTAELKLKGAAFIVGTQLAREPRFRKFMRDKFRKYAYLFVRPTKKGIKEIDENHPLYTVRYLKNKPIKEIQNDQFLYFLQGESLGLITCNISLDQVPNHGELPVRAQFFDNLTGLVISEDTSPAATQWNALRKEALKICYDSLSSYFAKETKRKLIEEAKFHVVQECGLRMKEWLSVAPYVPAIQQRADSDEDMTKCRILGIAYVNELDQASFCAMIDGDGEVIDHLRLVHLTKRRNSFNPEEARLKEQDLETLRQFVINKRPHVIALAGESLEAWTIRDDLIYLLADMEKQGELHHDVRVEIVENDLAKIYMNCRKAQQDFPDYPFLLRQAVSLARRLQDPLLEFCQICTPDEDILCLKYHPLQEMISKEELWNALQIEFINRVNEVGVDVNRCLEHPHTAAALQFVCGLGPRKAAYLLKILRQSDNLLENRTKLVTVCQMGPKVFMNCAGFIKIDTSRVAEKTDAYVEVLDGTRVHPETYEWARKMAVDALEYDDTTEDANPTSALEEILESPEKLRDLDLDAFAEELKRQGFGDKNITLYDIRAELTNRYKDMRSPYVSPDNTALFHMLTQDSDHVFKTGKLVIGRVTGIVYRKPKNEDEGMEPKRDAKTGMWQCSVCSNNTFAELSDVWQHFDQNQCPGAAVGVRVKLENGVNGFIPNRQLSDKPVEHPANRVQVGMPIYCRIMGLDANRFSLNLSCASSILRDASGQFKPPLDVYFDREAERLDAKKERSCVEKKQKQQYVKRVIAHPSFQNCSFKEAESFLESRDQGEVVIRPSSKGENHLTVTWKVTDGIYQHIDVVETHKDNAFSLGRTLQIGDETFEDLDEIIARHVEPMASYAREIINYKYYHALEDSFKRREEVERILFDEKRKNPSRISYIFTASKELPGKFMLSYLPRNKTRHEFVTVVPNGLRFRRIVHRNLNSLLTWFKQHFRDPIPGATPVTATPMDQASSHRGFTPRIDGMSVQNWPTRNFPPQNQQMGFQNDQMMPPPMYAASIHEQSRRAPQYPPQNYPVY